MTGRYLINTVTSASGKLKFKNLKSKENFFGRTPILFSLLFCGGAITMLFKLSMYQTVTIHSNDCFFRTRNFRELNFKCLQCKKNYLITFL